MSEIPISYPGRYAPGVALNFADATGAARQVSDSSPLPVAPVTGPSPVPLAGTAAAPVTVGPFVPIGGRPLILTLTGTWTGMVRLLRSADGGATRQPLSLAGVPWGQFTANVCEPVWEESEAAATFYLELSPASGGVTYRLAE